MTVPTTIPPPPPDPDEIPDTDPSPATLAPPRVPLISWPDERATLPDCPHPHPADEHQSEHRQPKD